MQEHLEDLQIRLTHQDLAIEALNQTVARQDRRIAELGEELARVRQLLAELKPSPLGADSAQEPPPPHY
jgi:SlyX protein